MRAGTGRADGFGTDGEQLSAGRASFRTALMPSGSVFAFKKELTGEQELLEFSGDIRLAEPDVAVRLGQDN